MVMNIGGFRWLINKWVIKEKRKEWKVIKNKEWEIEVVDI